MSNPTIGEIGFYKPDPYKNSPSVVVDVDSLITVYVPHSGRLLNYSKDEWIDAHELEARCHDVLVSDRYNRDPESIELRNDLLKGYFRKFNQAVAIAKHTQAIVHAWRDCEQIGCSDWLEISNRMSTVLQSTIGL